MMTRLIIIISTLFFTAGPGSAQIIYDVERAIATGLENNYSIIVAKNRETISDRKSVV